VNISKKTHRRNLPKMKTSVAAVLILAALGATLADVLFQEKFDDGEFTNTGVALLAGGGWWGGGGGGGFGCH
jgi:hypothetical protein